MDTLTSVSCIALARTPGTGLIGHIDYGVSLLGYLYPVPLGSGHAKNCRSTYFFRPNWLGVINTVCSYFPDILKVSVYLPIFCRQVPGLDVKNSTNRPFRVLSESGLRKLFVPVSGRVRPKHHSPTEWRGRGWKLF